MTTATLTAPAPVATPAALDLYAHGLDGAEPLMARDAGGSTWPLPLARWLGPLTIADEDVLARAVAPVLDVGCGPGRHVLALARRGRLAVGVDVSPAAVRMARGRGAAAIEGSVFAHVPGAGTWGSALLLDGNIGIGGRPAALLTRVASLLRPGGIVLVELAPPGVPGVTQRLRLEGAGAVSAWFDWATVSVDDVAGPAARAGLVAAGTWEVQGRWFACLRRKTGSYSASASGCSSSARMRARNSAASAP